MAACPSLILQRWRSIFEGLSLSQPITRKTKISEVLFMAGWPSVKKNEITRYDKNLTKRKQKGYSLPSFNFDLVSLTSQSSTSSTSKEGTGSLLRPNAARSAWSSSWFSARAAESTYASCARRRGTAGGGGATEFETKQFWKKMAGLEKGKEIHHMEEHDEKKKIEMTGWKKKKKIGGRVLNTVLMKPRNEVQPWIKSDVTNVDLLR